MKARIILTGILFAVFCTVSLSYGDVPQMITYQCKLTTPQGGMIDTTVSMVFSIYADTLGTTPLWNETQPSVPVEKGTFNVLLGAVNPLPDTVFTGDVRYLGIKVGSDPEMTPRRPLLSVGYALRSEFSEFTDTAEYARVAPAMPDADWFISGSNVYRPAGNVGIGTLTPGYTLDIQKVEPPSGATAPGVRVKEYTSDLGPSAYLLLGKSRGTPSFPLMTWGGDTLGVVEGFGLACSQPGCPDAVAARMVFVQEGDGVPPFFVPGSIAFQTSDGCSAAVERMKIGSGGTVTLRGKLDVDQNRIVNVAYPPSADRDAATKKYVDDHWMISGNHMYSTPAGSVGIGTQTPGEKLEVVGDLKVNNIRMGHGVISDPEGVHVIIDDDASPAQEEFFSVRKDGKDVATSTQLFRIEENGNVGIGITTSPEAKLHIGGTAGVDGIKFPDETLQTTAATGGDITAVIAGTGLEGGGESNDVTLNVQVPLSLSGETSSGGIIEGRNTGTGYGVYGKATGSSDATSYGGFFVSTFGPGVGVLGNANGQGDYENYGGEFNAAGDRGRAVYGVAWADGDVRNYGGYFEAHGGRGRGVYGFAFDDAGKNYGVYGETRSSEGYGGYFVGRGFFSGNVGIGAEQPSAKMHILQTADDADAFRVDDEDSDNTPFVVRSDGKVGIDGCLYHTRDPQEDTYIEFTTDDYATNRIDLYCMGVNMISANKDNVFDEVVINEGSADIGFRVAASGNNPNAFVVRGSDGYVGIGTSALANRLDVEGGVAVGAGYSGLVVAPPDGMVIEGNVGIGASGPTHKLTVQGDINHVNSSGQTLCFIAEGTDGSGNISTYGPNGNLNVWLKSHSQHANYGLIEVADNNGTIQAGMYVNNEGKGRIWADIKNFRMSNPNEPGTEIWYACPEGPEAAAYVRGTAHLTNGKAEIVLADHFKAVASPDGITVQLTPLSAESRGLAVVEKGLDQLVVRELGNGEGTYDFDFLVMAVRRGYEDYQVIRPVSEVQPAEGHEGAQPSVD